MKSCSAIFCALALFLILNVAHAKSLCTPMDPKEKATYEKVYDTDFMGCTLTTGEAMTVMYRLNWLTPKGGHPLVEMDTDALSETYGLSKTEGGSMMMTALKVAGASVGGEGYLTVSPECVDSLPPDFIYSALAKSETPKVFNAILEAECEKGTVRNIKNTVRFDEDTMSIAEAIVCILGTVIGIFFPFFTPALITTLKTIVDNALTILPCPSIVARAVDVVG